MNHTAKKQIYKIFLYTVAILLSIAFVAPFYYTLVNSLKGLYDTPSMIPQGFNLSNYKLAVTLIPFFDQLKNSLLLILFDAIPCFIFNLIIGFAFARLKAPGKSFIFMLVLSTLILPQVATQIPQYLMYTRIGLTNTFWIWTIGAIGGNAVYIFLYRQFFAGIPKELEEAARIDGCSFIIMLVRIFIPLAVPVIVIVTFQDFFWVWSDFMTPFMYLHMDKWPLSTALFGVSYSIEGSPNVQLDSLVDAAAILLLVPVIIAFAFAQSYLVEGISTTGIKA
jgi:ABC-type glycerol-3-phosphate transport system permease component